MSLSYSLVHPWWKRNADHVSSLPVPNPLGLGIHDQNHDELEDHHLITSVSMQPSKQKKSEIIQYHSIYWVAVIWPTNKTPQNILHEMCRGLGFWGMHGFVFKDGQARVI